MANQNLGCNSNYDDLKGVRCFKTAKPFIQLLEIPNSPGSLSPWTWGYEMDIGKRVFLAVKNYQNSSHRRHDPGKKQDHVGPQAVKCLVEKKCIFTRNLIKSWAPKSSCPATMMSLIPRLRDLARTQQITVADWQPTPVRQNIPVPEANPHSGRVLAHLRDVFLEI